MATIKRNKVRIPTYNFGQVTQAVVNDAPSLTKQSEAEACDVNNIVRRYDRTGVITHLQSAQAVFADVSEIGSYLDAVQRVDSAQESFMALPSGLRSHFENDPARFVDWAREATPEDRDDLFAQVTGKNRVTDARPDPVTATADTPETGD